jgi:hypothetical protein
MCAKYVEKLDYTSRIILDFKELIILVLNKPAIILVYCQSSECWLLFVNLPDRR